MDPEDLLYTNLFRKTESLSKEQLQENANNFLPYRTLKANSVNNVRDDIEKSVFSNNPIVQREQKAYGWNKGGLANQTPVLSDFARDIAESSYYRYKTTYLNIDSRMRDVVNYPRPNNYQVFLGKKFDNVESIKLIDYFFPDAPYPINENNNVIMWMTVPYEAIIFNASAIMNVDIPYGVPFVPFTANLNIFQWTTDFNQMILVNQGCNDAATNFGNDVIKSIYAIKIPPGYYTTAELERKIEQLWRQTFFFDSSLYPPATGIDYYAPDGSPTLTFVNKPQLVKARIDPVTSQVSFMLRYEEFKIDYIRSYLGKNYIDIRLKSEDPSVPSEEYLIFANNDTYPLIPTGFPSVGGIPSDLYNYFEFATKAQHDAFTNPAYNTYQPPLLLRYYDVVINPDTGVPIPNIIRLFLYDIDTRRNILASSNEVLKLDDTCGKFCEGVIGREAPFFLIKGTESPIFEFVRAGSNNKWVLTGGAAGCDECADVEGLDTATKALCAVLPQLYLTQLNSFICNTDGSNRLLTNLLGFRDTANSLAQVGPQFYAFAITTNLIYKTNSYLGTVSTALLADQQSINYIQCIRNTYGANAAVFINYETDATILNFKLPVCKNPDGTYSFYIDNYMFLKLLNPVLQNQVSNSALVQVKPTGAFANGSSDKYLYLNDKID